MCHRSLSWGRRRLQVFVCVRCFHSILLLWNRVFEEPDGFCDEKKTTLTRTIASFINLEETKQMEMMRIRSQKGSYKSAKRPHGCAQIRRHAEPHTHKTRTTGGMRGTTSSNIEYGTCLVACVRMETVLRCVVAQTLTYTQTGIEAHTACSRVRTRAVRI